MSREVNQAGLGTILGKVGETNVQGEEVQKLDVFANRAVHRRPLDNCHVSVIASEEDEDLIHTDRDERAPARQVRGARSTRWTARRTST